jgi:DNA-binding transcriptional LysR family regulator
VAFRTADTLVAAGLVRAGLGVALLPRQAAIATAGPGLTTLTLTTPVRRVTHLTTRAGSTHPGIAPLLAALRAHACPSPRVKAPDAINRCENDAT